MDAQSLTMLWQGAAAPMFPFEDEDDELAQDDYGLALRPGEFQLLDGTAPGEFAGTSPSFYDPKS